MRGREDIAAACQEQSAGIDQVNRVVGQVDRVTQDNTAETEELSSTSHALAAQAQEMLALVSRFTLPEDDEGRAFGGAGLERARGERVSPSLGHVQLSPTDAVRAKAAEEDEVRGHWRPRPMRAAVPHGHTNGHRRQGFEEVLG